MLYHWYELDLETAAPPRATHREPAHVDAPCIQYNAATAIANANGAPFQLLSPAQILNAANDQKIDTVAMRLRLAGLGVIGDPALRAKPGDYCLIRQTIRLCRSAVRFVTTCTLDAVRLITRKREQYVSSCSHTMVSNNSDDEATTRDDARRQRFNASIG